MQDCSNMDSRELMRNVALLLGAATGNPAYGAAMSFSSCQNPSLTYMAWSSSAADNAVKMLKDGAL